MLHWRRGGSRREFHDADCLFLQIATGFTHAALEHPYSKRSALGAC
jgi:hypothetical protein